MPDDTSISAPPEYRQSLFELVDRINESHESIITSKRGNAVLVSEENWRSIQETLYLKSIPGIWESIQEGVKEPIDECLDKLPW